MTNFFCSGPESAQVHTHTPEELERRVEQRTAELEFFVHAVVHDLRSPLRNIDGYAQILAQQHFHNQDPEGKRLLEIIRGEVGYMGQFLQDLLNFSRLGAQPLAGNLVDMTALARSVYETLTAGLGRRNLQLKLATLPPAHGDEAMLRQVFFNLLSNALKYTEACPETVIEISARQQDGLCEYCVRDNGIGFDMAEAGKLFRPFERLGNSRSHDGTGLGLAIAQRIIHRHGGRVWAQSSPGQGAAFHFTAACCKPA